MARPKLVQELGTHFLSNTATAGSSQLLKYTTTTERALSTSRAGARGARLNCLLIGARPHCRWFFVSYKGHRNKSIGRLASRKTKHWVALTLAAGEQPRDRHIEELNCKGLATSLVSVECGEWRALATANELGAATMTIKRRRRAALRGWTPLSNGSRTEDRESSGLGWELSYLLRRWHRQHTTTS